ncbi:hypothetical protein CAEBREN_20939 [Caenorhabditis brenneri]|uniref:Uncharacterized protein n=1 Tax=Caenorhabditis brenneri TaxID=135651 RepID=G0NNT3_CAEBE|nr:hypothetical protein CAEBREN_20939 [Caenorhabditis brenneri]
MCGKKRKEDLRIDITLLCLNNGSYLPHYHKHSKARTSSTATQSSMTGQNATLPREHIQRIQEILRNHLRFDRNPHMATFKIDVAREPIQMNASLISNPQSLQDQPKSEKTLSLLLTQ